MSEEKGIRSIEIEHEMQQSYLDYAMSVIISRALPDARDGLKPVQRRILYAMYDMGFRPDTPFKKSARIVGEVLGKYHPHGDSAVYDAMARLAQDFTIRYPLVEGQGNFGSIDGDPPAAMRYTEARLDKFSIELLEHIDQDTVDFADNFDGTLKEPTVLPSIVPNLLVNGASGIAVGMATNIPPHNLGEVCDAIIYMLQEWENYDDITVDDLMRYIKGPDFPTGGIIVLEDARNELVSAYATGRGRLMVRGRVHLEDMGRGRSRLIITEIPYQINKNSLIERIAHLVREGTIEGVTDLRDESDRQGMRIVIELAKSVDAEDVLRKLYKHTPLQTTFGIILLALVDNQPKVMTLKQALKVYADHQIEVLIRRTKYELNKAEKRAHILEGLLIAIDNLDRIIQIIRNSENEAEARKQIMSEFSLDEVQAQAILDMPLKRLTHLEHDKIKNEYDALEIYIHEMRELLDSPEKIREEIINELNELRDHFDDPRRTRITVLGEGVSSKEVLTANALVDADDVWVGVTEDGKIGRVPFEKVQEKAFELPQMLIRSDTQQTIYCVSETGKAFGVYAETLPNVAAFRDGLDIRSLCNWDEDEKLAVVFSLPDGSKRDENAAVITVTEKALIKKSLASELPFASAQSFALCKVNPGDRLVTVLISPNDDYDILLASRDGMAIRFGQQDMRPIGLVAAGVNGMKFRKDDRLVAAMIVSEADSCCFVTSEWGLGQITVKDFPRQGRYGLGVIALKLAESVFVTDVARMLDGKSKLFIRYGKSKLREVRTALAAIGRRARSLSPLVKTGKEPAAGLLLLDLTEPVKEEPKTPEAPVVEPEPEERHDEPKPGKDGDDPEQISLF